MGNSPGWSGSDTRGGSLRSLTPGYFPCTPPACQGQKPKVSYRLERYLRLGVTMQEGFVGRQPIYKDGVDLFAYELFSHNSELKQAAFANGDTVTAEALLHECLGVGLGSVTGKHPAFV